MLRNVILSFFFMFGLSSLYGQGFPLIVEEGFNFFPQETVQLNDNQLLSVCTTTITQNAPILQRVVLLRFNNSGDFISSTLVSDSTMRAESIGLTAEGNVLLLAERYEGTVSKYPVVFSIAPDGQVNWSKEFDYYLDFDAIDMKVLEDNSFVLTANNNDPPLLEAKYAYQM